VHCAAKKEMLSTNGLQSFSNMAIEGVRGNGNECTNGINGYAGSVNGANVTTNGSTTRISDTAGPTEPPMPIAICGMGLRLPGGVRNDSDLYDFLVNKKDARSLVPKDRYDIDSFYSPYAKPGTIITKHGYFLEDVDFSKFDLSMFNMTPAETERLDPHQRILLEVVREAFESAGEADFRGKKIGTYVGSFTDDWLELFGKDVIDCAPYQLHGKMDFALGNRVAYEYDLRGPRYVQDA
jgi:acyl transferase domain-containing protein